MVISPIPQTRDLIKTEIRSEGAYPRTRFIAVFYYPNCVREFDGSNWTVVAVVKE